MLGAISSLRARENLRKTYPAGPGLPFAYPRVALHFAILNNFFLLLTIT